MKTKISLSLIVIQFSAILCPSSAQDLFLGGVRKSEWSKIYVHEEFVKELTGESNEIYLENPSSNQLVQNLVGSLLISDTVAFVCAFLNIEHPTTELQTINFKKDTTYYQVALMMDSVSNKILNKTYFIRIRNLFTDAITKGPRRDLLDEKTREMQDNVWRRPEFRNTNYFYLKPNIKSVINPFGYKESSDGNVYIKEYDLKANCLKVLFQGSTIVDKYVLDNKYFLSNQSKRKKMKYRDLNCHKENIECIEIQQGINELIRMENEVSEANKVYSACIEMNDSRAIKFENIFFYSMYLGFTFEKKAHYNTI